ncbi:MAG: Fe-S cluster assembly ATPase SufC [Acholeplasmatales bacterium]|jgi:Fe-S cluster assembly ATP-binding protein|nr:Fe-S cluster assembly ATPase SufC [Acholeplasmatales bacterium]
MLLLSVKDLCVKIDDKDILDKINLEINEKEVHVIMGKNGTGKTTLGLSLMGHPSYNVSGSISFQGEELINKTPDYRSRKGIFLSMQNPIEIKGVNNSDFYRAILKAHQKSMKVFDFALKYESELEALNMKPDLASRFLNDGFSGGEKKKNEVLQMKFLEPKLIILDEIDSGLDVDALKIVGSNISKLVENGASLIVITHYKRILDYVKVDKVHVIDNKKIVLSGDRSLVEKIDVEGFDGI